ncbi:MAG: CPBP family glutamic-type intramembrane protease [Mycoplasma sp.]
MIEQLNHNNDDYLNITLSKLNHYGFHKISRIIFIFLTIFCPILVNIIFSYAIHISSSDRDLFTMILTMITTSLSFIALVILQGNIILKTGYTFFAFFSLFMGPIIFMIMLLIGMLGFSNDDANIISIWVQVLGEIGAAVLGFYLFDNVRKQYKETIIGFKNPKNIGYYLMIVGGGFVSAYIITILFGKIGITQLSSNDGGNTNQNTIDKLLKGSLAGAIPMVMLTTLVAPVLEELATREGIFAIFGNEKKSWNWTIGAVCSLLYFSNMHVGSSDFKYIIDYMGTAIPLIGAYMLGNRNTLYSIPIHSIWNIMVLVNTYTT